MPIRSDLSDIAAPLTELKSAWLDLVAREEAVFKKCVELEKVSTVNTNEKSEAVREWWGVANAMLWMFVRTRAQFDHELQPFPAYTLGRLANISEEISVGNIPGFVTDAKRPGRALWRKERHHIAYGILYIEAVRRGEIDDRAPNQTVRQRYNVTSRAVQLWMKRRDEICVGVPYRHLSAKQLSEKMKECAAINARIGRGAPSTN